MVSANPPSPEPHIIATLGLRSACGRPRTSRLADSFARWKRVGLGFGRSIVDWEERGRRSSCGFRCGPRLFTQPWCLRKAVGIVTLCASDKSEKGRGLVSTNFTGWSVVWEEFRYFECDCLFYRQPFAGSAAYAKDENPEPQQVTISDVNISSKRLLGMPGIQACSSQWRVCTSLPTTSLNYVEARANVVIFSNSRRKTTLQHTHQPWLLLRHVGDHPSVFQRD